MTGTKELHPPSCSVSAASVAIAVISSFLFGYSICVLNSCGELIAVVFQWCGNSWQSDCMASRGSQALVNGSLYLGAAIGALLPGRLLSLGTRRQLIISDVYFGAGALLCALGQGVGTLVVGRFASGVGLGISAIAAPWYIAEISPRERRGLHAAMNGVLITVGILASEVIGLPQGPPPGGPEDTMQPLDVWYWRVLLGFPLLPALIQATLFCVCPNDPPSFLVMQTHLVEARAMLYRIYGHTPCEVVDMNDKKQALLELQFNELKEAATMAKNTPRIRMVQAICDPFLRTATLLGLGLAAFQQLSGINGLMSYSNSLFAEAGIAPNMLTWASTAMAVANVLASVLSSKMVDHWGRRKLLLFGSFFQTLAMGCLSFIIGRHSSSSAPLGFMGPAAVVCFTIFVMSFSFGLGAVTWLYLSEIYPMEIRGPALSACGVVNWISSFIVVFGTRFLSLEQACHAFGLICLLGCWGTYAYVIETKGCSMDDSPLTPKSGRSSSNLLSPSSPRADFTKMGDEEESEFTMRHADVTAVS